MKELTAIIGAAAFLFFASQFWNHNRVLSWILIAIPVGALVFRVL